MTPWETLMCQSLSNTEKYTRMNKSEMNGEAMMVSQTGILVVKSFLQEKYLFRRNVLNGKVEFVTKSTAAKNVSQDN